MDILKLFASIALRTVGLHQLQHFDVTNLLLLNISSGSCHVVGN